MKTKLIIGSEDNFFAISYKGKVAYAYADSPLILASQGALYATGMLILMLIEAYPISL